MPPLTLSVCVLAVAAQPAAQRRRRTQRPPASVFSAGPGQTPVFHALVISSIGLAGGRAQAISSARAGRRSRRPFVVSSLPDDDKVSLAYPDVAREAAGRLTRLELLVQLGRLYQKFVYAEKLLSDKSPFARTRIDAVGKADAEDEPADGDDPAALMNRVREIEELQETAAKIQAIHAFNGFPDKIGQLFEVDSSKNGADGRVTAASARDVLQNTVEAEFQRLTGRAASCLAALPYGSVEEARLSAEYEFLRLKQEAAEADNGIVPRLPNALGEKVDGLGQKVERLGQKAKKAEAKIEKGWEGFKERPLTVIKDVASYGQGVWVRLNGGGRSTRKGAAAVLDTLPAARSSKQEHEARMVSLALEAEEADKRLAEASKARETRLRKRDNTRTLLAQDIGELDAEVRKTRVTLAVCQLAVEMERLFYALEEEAVEAGQEAAESPLSAQRSNDELSIFVSEYGALDAALARARALAQRDEILILPDEELDDLARNIRDLTTRLGLSEEDGVGGGISVGMMAEKGARGARDAFGKVTEGAGFLARGVRMLGADLSASARIFLRALFGSTLKPREVQTLRRTSLDVLSFIPFTVILIAPISPIGHVLVFSFIQKYFPGFYPSQFTTKRQELFQKFEELNAKLAAAEAAATEETLAAALKRAQEVVEALTREGSVDSGKLDLLAALKGEGGGNGNGAAAAAAAAPNNGALFSEAEAEGKQLAEAAAEKQRGGR